MLSSRKTDLHLEAAPRDPRGRTGQRAGPILRDELTALAVRVERALAMGDRFLETNTVLGSIHCQRDILHLRARIEGISRQIDDAISTLNRIEDRDPGLTVGDKPWATPSPRNQESVKTAP